MPDEETHLSVLGRFGLAKVQDILGGLRRRKEQVRQELEDVESIEELVDNLLAGYDEMLGEVDRAAKTIQTAVTRVRNQAAERRAVITRLLSKEQ